MEITGKSYLVRGAKWLAKNDSILGPVISQVGACNLTSHDKYFQALVESIVGQQLSLKSAAAILRRFRIYYGLDFPTPQQVLDTPTDTLRTLGFSGAKVNYISSLSQHIIDGSIDFSHLVKLSDLQIINELTKVNGIGEWTAQMFLIFCLGREDVLAYGDLGIRSGIQKLYRLDTIASPSEVKALAVANKWSPYQSVACWYIWRSLEIKSTG